MSKPLDMADKYEPLSYQDADEYVDVDSEPTIKVQVPTFLPKVIVSESDDPSWDDEDTEVMPQPPIHGETRYPGIGLALVVLGGGAFWGAIFWWLFG
jgi:hypothetical protein